MDVTTFIYHASGWYIFAGAFIMLVGVIVGAIIANVSE